MLKLIKYEFKKQFLSKLIILFLTLLGELVFLFGIFIKKDNTAMTGTMLLFFIGFGAICFLAFESIFTLSNDLKTKNSYMLFLTPHTSYTIVGAKVITTAIQVLLAGLFFGLLALLDFTVLTIRWNGFEQIKIVFLWLIEQLTQIKIDGNLVFLLLLLFLLSWILTITLGFFSITLSSTFLANNRAKGFISFLIFLFLNWGFNKLFKTLSYSITQDTYMFLIIGSICTFIFVIITYIGTAWMLDKKVSL